MAHRGEEITFHLTRVFRFAQCSFKLFLCLSLRVQDVRYIRPNEADPSKPQIDGRNVHFFRSDLTGGIVHRKDEGVASLLF